jgi:hypothetical protein
MDYSALQVAKATELMDESNYQSHSIGLEINLLYWKKMDDSETGWFCRITHQINK